MFDHIIATELSEYLKKTGHAIIVEDAIITTKDNVLDDLAAFAIKTNRQSYQIKFFEDVVIFSKEIPMEEMGLKSCKMCGFLAKTNSDLGYHQNAHLPGSWTHHIV
ncbi:hypothetical protein [Candidatus Nitrosotenuis aquarius]|uniref:hypothetical protein n=1 Tax=Candidatus Nitrosotenuis aquarius TaxID=1846278 RepID=UPI0013C2AEF7|nr:hypothetical protein [Candidatus Nitrosotenuis aquarius]